MGHWVWRDFVARGLAVAVVVAITLHFHSWVTLAVAVATVQGASLAVDYYLHGSRHDMERKE